MTDTPQAPFSTEAVSAAQRACIKHARDLLASARAVEATGHSNIAYHLGVLALEEIGRRALIGVQMIADKASVPPTWPHKHTQNHVQKIFWCLFDRNFFSGQLSGKALDDLMAQARDIHFMRVAGLYVDQGDDGLSIPSDAIDVTNCKLLLDFVEARLNLAEIEPGPDSADQNSRDLQAWFLKSTDDPDKRRQIFSGTSMSKLAELRDTQAWARWLKKGFEDADRESQRWIEEELKRNHDVAPGGATKDKWKLRIRILSASHSIRPKALNSWNETCSWIKLSPVSGKKNELIVEFILGDSIPVDALWFFGLGLARHFVVALNLATLGFWWWRMPEQISRYYEDIEDIESKASVGIERSPSLKVDWGANRVLTDQDMRLTAACFVALPGPQARDQHAAHSYYLSGLNFLSLNDIHWQCEGTSFGNFWHSLRAMMEEAGDWNSSMPFVPAFMKLLNELFPTVEDPDRYAAICAGYDTDKTEGLNVNLGEVAFMKIVCDAYFLRTIRPAVKTPSSSDKV